VVPELRWFLLVSFTNEDDVDNRYVAEDGWEVTEKKPSAYLLELPRYADWLLFLLMRGLAHIVGKDSAGRVKIEATEQRPIFSEGELRWRCINCGGFFDKMELSEMVIGSVVRMHYEKVTDLMLHQREEGSRPQPVMKKGLGCGDCLNLYMASLSEISQINRMRESDNLEAAQYAVATGKRTKLKSELKPFIDVFRDGYHLEMRRQLEDEAGQA
jgi:hypothetical protein